MDSGRYIVYGVVADSEHEQGNPDLDPAQQRIGNTIPVYATDDQDEAKALVREGGFLRTVGEKQIWCAVQWAKDTVGGGTIGNVPA
jgi:hypothetical protein